MIGFQVLRQLAAFLRANDLDSVRNWLAEHDVTLKRAKNIPLYDITFPITLEALKLILPYMYDIPHMSVKYKSIWSIICQHDTVDIAEYCVKQGAFVDFDAITYPSALHVAAQSNQLNMVKFLIEQGANPLKLNSSCRNALLVSKSMEVVKYLLPYSAPKRIFDNDNVLTHCLRSFTMTREDVKYLIDKGCALNDTNYAEAPLSVAVQHQSIDIVNYLLQLGADKTVKSRRTNGNLVFHAVLRGDMDMLRYVVEELRMCVDQIVFTHAFRTKKSHEILKYLAAKGGEENVRTDKHNNLLRISIQMRSIDQLNTAINVIGSTSHKDKTILHESLLYTLKNDYLTMAQYLIDNLQANIHNLECVKVAIESCGANGEIVQFFIDNKVDITSTQHPVVPIAISAKRFTVAKLLIENNAPVKYTELIQPPITCAYLAWSGNFDSELEYLLSKGAKIYRYTKFKAARSSSPLETFLYGNEYVIDRLCQSDVICDKGNLAHAIDAMIKHQSKRIFNNLFTEGGVNPNIVIDGLTPLARLCDVGETGDILDQLLGIGASVNGVKGQTHSPLHLAARRGDIKLCKVLIEKKADVNVLDADGNTPFMNATRSGNGQCLELLLKSGAIVNHINHNDETALHRLMLSNNNDEFVVEHAQLITHIELMEDVNGTGVDTQPEIAGEVIVGDARAWHHETTYQTYAHISLPVVDDEDEDMNDD